MDEGLAGTGDGRLADIEVVCDIEVGDIQRRRARLVGEETKRLLERGGFFSSEKALETRLCISLEAGDPRDRIQHDVFETIDALII